MSHSRISRNADLTALVEDGYNIDIIGGYLLVRNIPYVTETGDIRTGDIVSTLELQGENTASPLSDHTVWWTGQMPHYADRTSMKDAICSNVWTKGRSMGNGLEAYSRWSIKPRHKGGHRAYRDQKEKIDTYVNEITGQADVLRPGVLEAAKSGAESEVAIQSRFKYLDMNAFRSGTRGIEQAISDEVVAVIGIGGSGSYLVDILAKTNIKELHLYDDDVLLQHNAFRLAGAAQAGELTGNIKKVDWHKNNYVAVRDNGIYAHDKQISVKTLAELNHCTMVFIAVDRLDVRRSIQTHCEALGIAHIAVGLGIDIEGEDNDQLGGMVKVEVQHCPRIRNDEENREIMAQADDDDMYGNIQTAELNMLSAALAIIEWKALRGFYTNDRPADIDSQTYVVPTGKIRIRTKSDT